MVFIAIYLSFIFNFQLAASSKMGRSVRNKKFVIAIYDSEIVKYNMKYTPCGKKLMFWDNVLGQGSIYNITR